jgi:hypothetical protein
VLTLSLGGFESTFVHLSREALSLLGFAWIMVVLIKKEIGGDFSRTFPFSYA